MNRRRQALIVGAAMAKRGGDRQPKQQGLLQQQPQQYGQSDLEKGLVSGGI